MHPAYSVIFFTSASGGGYMLLALLGLFGALGILPVDPVLGVVGFGGPAAHIAMMREEVVRRRAWVSDERFMDLVGATNLIPGPNSTELAMHLGWERARWRGLVVGGVCFIAPATLIVGGLAWAYVRYGTTPTFTDLLYGVVPAVLAVITLAIVPLLRAAWRGVNAAPPRGHRERSREVPCPRSNRARTANVKLSSASSSVPRPWARASARAAVPFA